MVTAMVSNSSTAHWGFSMSLHESIKDKPSDEAAGPAAATGADVTPKMALAGIDLPRIEMPKIEAPAIEILKIESAIIEPPKSELAGIEAPHIVPEIDEPKPPSAESAAAAPADDADADAAPETGPRVNKFMLLAASLALSAALGGMAGALGAYGLMRPAPAPVVAAGRTGLEEIQALKENVVQARVEIAALKVSIDAGNRGANAQFTRIGERIERIERVQAEPAAKLNKAIETLDRMARADAQSVTGSIPAAQPVAGGAPATSGLVEGWVVRDVHRGTALIEGRMGLIEVDQGDVVPGLGRVEAIRKQDGRWVVVTSKGLITSAR
jgi:hypothetical protein